MNTNKAPAPVPLWYRGQIHDIVVTRPEPDRPEDPEPDSDAANLPIPATAEPSLNRSNSKTSTPRLKKTYDRHRRKCTICHHRQREAIENAFMNWLSPETIVAEFKLRGRAVLYRHAEAYGLPALRRRLVRGALDRLIEHAETARVSGSTVIRAIIVSGRLNDDGIYIEPPKRHEIAYVNEAERPNSNRDTKLLETSVTPTK